MLCVSIRILLSERLLDVSLSDQGVEVKFLLDVFYNHFDEVNV